MMKELSRLGTYSNNDGKSYIIYLIRCLSVRIESTNYIRFIFIFYLFLSICFWTLFIPSLQANIKGIYLSEVISSESYDANYSSESHDTNSTPVAISSSSIFGSHHYYHNNHFHSHGAGKNMHEDMNPVKGAFDVLVLFYFLLFYFFVFMNQKLYLHFFKNKNGH